MRLLIAATVLLLFNLCTSAHAISFDEFKRNISQKFPHTTLANDFDGVIESAVVNKIGDGSRKMIVFVDPYCVFCLKLESNLRYLDNVTIYTLLMPLDQLHPQATKAIERIWCAADRSAALHEWFRHKAKESLNSDVHCATPAQSNKQLSEDIKMYGTPTVIFSDGAVKYGAVSPYTMESMLGF